MGTSLERAKSRLKHDELTLRFYDPKSQLNEKKKRLADAEDTLLRLIAERQQETRRDLQNVETLLRRSMADRLAADKRNLAVKSERLWGLSPLKKIAEDSDLSRTGMENVWRLWNRRKPENGSRSG